VIPLLHLKRINVLSDCLVAFKENVLNPTPYLWEILAITPLLRNGVEMQIVIMICIVLQMENALITPQTLLLVNITQIVLLLVFVVAIIMRQTTQALNPYAQPMTLQHLLSVNPPQMPSSAACKRTNAKTLCL